MTFYIHHYLSGLIMYNVLCNNVLYSITTTSWNKWKICFTCCFRMFFSCLVLCFTSSCCSFSSFGIFIGFTWVCFSLLCILTLPSPLSCFQFTHFFSCALHICFRVHGFVSCVILTYFECIFVSFFTHLEKKPNFILRLSFLIFHLWPVVHDPSSVAHRKEIFISTFW